MTSGRSGEARGCARAFASTRRRRHAPPRMLETHISFVLLTGTHAYKIKKAVDFGFLDFTTLAARRFFCEEELRLNRRLAPAALPRRRADHRQRRRAGPRRPGTRARIRGEDARISAGRAGQPVARGGELERRRYRRARGESRRLPRRDRRRPPDGCVRHARRNPASRAAELRADSLRCWRRTGARRARGAPRLDRARARRSPRRIPASPRSKASCASATATCISTTSRASTASSSSSTASSSTRRCAGST